MATESSAQLRTRRRSLLDVATAQPPSIWRLAARRLGKHRAIALAQLTAMTVASALPVAIITTSAAAADRAYHTAIQPGSSDSLVTVQAAGAQSVSAFDGLQKDISSTVSRAVPSQLVPVADYGRLGPFATTSLNDRPYSISPSVVMAAYFPDLQSHATLNSGNWGTGSTTDLQATMSAEGALRLGLKAGDRVCISPPRVSEATPSCFTLAGTWRRTSRTDSFWLAGPGPLDVTFGAPSYWQLQQLVSKTRSVAGAVFAPNSENDTASGAQALYDGLVRLKGYYQVSRGVAVLTTLDRSIAGFLQSVQHSQYLVQLVAVEVLLVALYGLGFTTASYLGSQQEQATLWRTRGWTRQKLWRFLAAQMVLLAAPAAVLSLLLSGGLASLAIGSPSQLASHAGRALEVAAVAQAAIIVVCLILAFRFSWRSVGEMRMGAAPVNRPAWWLTGRVAAGALVLALPILVEASLRGETAVRSASGSGDLIGLLLPALGLALLSLVGLRLLPATAVPLRLAKRSVPVRLASWRLGRRGNEHAGAALLLTLAFAVGLFASVYQATVVGNAIDRAGYAAGADIRISLNGSGGVEAVRESLGGLGAKSAAAPLLRAEVATQNTNQTLTAIGADGTEFSKVAWSRSDVSASALGAQLDQLAGPLPTMELSGKPDALKVTVTGFGGPGSLIAVVKDAGGQLCTCSFGSLAFSGSRTLQAAISFPQAVRYPLQLTALRIDRLSGPAAELDLRQLASVEGSSTVILDSLTLPRGWWARDSEGVIYAPNESAADGLELSLPQAGSVTIYPPYPSDAGVPMLMDRTTMARLGILPGFEVPVVYDLHSIRATVVGTVGDFPTLYPGTDSYVLIPLSRAASALGAGAGEAITPNEVWIRSGPAAQQAAELAGPSTDVSYVVTRSAQERLALADPVLIQLRADLLIGFLSALALAALGFGVHFLIASRRRLAEHAILQANGLDPAEIRTGISIEQAAVIVVAVIWSAAVAAIAVVILLPSLQLGTSVEAATPPTLVRLDSGQLALAGGVVLVAMLGLGWLTRLVGSAVDVVGELRRLG